MSKAITNDDYEQLGKLLAHADRLCRDTFGVSNSYFIDWLNDPIRRPKGRTLLHHAVVIGADPKIIDLLLQFGMEDSPDRKGFTPSSMINKRGLKEVFEQHGVTVEASNKPKGGKNARKKAGIIARKQAAADAETKSPQVEETVVDDSEEKTV